MGCVLTLRKKLDTDTGKQRVVCALPVSIEKQQQLQRGERAPTPSAPPPPAGNSSSTARCMFIAT